MKAISSQTQLGLVGLAYAAFLVIAAAMLYGRHLQELQYPAEASGGMWAAGDAFLWIFIAFLFLIPTGLLIWVIAKVESYYGVYSKVLLAFSLSAPVSLAAVVLGQKHLSESISNLCQYRLVWSPLILMVLGVSWLAARFGRAKRLILYSLLVEGLTLAAGVALLVRAWSGSNHH